jgi:hypothetical protein
MKSLESGKVEFLRVLSARIVPESGALDAAGWGRFLAIVDDALQERKPAVRRQFGVFLGVLRWAPAVRYGSRFDGLPAARQDAVLRWFEDCPLSLLRKGFWGLKAMVFMGYYGQPETHERIGYRARFDGREALRA